MGTLRRTVCGQKCGVVLEDVYRKLLLNGTLSRLLTSYCRVKLNDTSDFEKSNVLSEKRTGKELFSLPYA